MRNISARHTLAKIQKSTLCGDSVQKYFILTITWLDRVLDRYGEGGRVRQQRPVDQIPRISLKRPLNGEISQNRNAQFWSPTQASDVSGAKINKDFSPQTSIPVPHPNERRFTFFALNETGPKPSMRKNKPIDIPVTKSQISVPHKWTLFTPLGPKSSRCSASTVFK